ncbi:DNA/RNA non-specific endonuclease [Pseudomonas sp. PDM09]|jgi:hypothetical protein|uniref:DNA/RNA non-specific endonuclease n=1 Tax=Pseudomonas TaxID=286 RepID=UPI00177E7C99|nr:DNA/RNA non-specific endonuclease [Pseudomonas sp. PDM09]MBD9562864.1 DNA/RNA non-specific endonuclease [Pseudomonas sp. PDM09]
MPIIPEYKATSINVNGSSVTVPLYAKAILTSNNMSGGSGPDQSLHPPGFISGSCPQHHQRGHLIGNQLGGSGTDLRNLVTLTEGTNHPIMYEYELMVYKHVKANPGINFIYQVTAQYDPSRYLTAQVAPGGSTSGAANNPYCPMPCPESLRIDFFYAESPGVLVYPLVYRVLTEHGEGWTSDPLYILNGVYKFHEGSPRHVALGCWAS